MMSSSRWRTALHGRSNTRCKRPLIHGDAVALCPHHLYQIIRTRQAAGVCGENAIGTHASPQVPNANRVAQLVPGSQRLVGVRPAARRLATPTYLAFE